MEIFGALAGGNKVVSSGPSGLWCSNGMQFRGISLDLLFVALMDLTLPPTLDIMQNRILRGMDEKSVRSVNGCRVTDTILAKARHLS